MTADSRELNNIIQKNRIILNKDPKMEGVGREEGWGIKRIEMCYGHASAPHEEGDYVLQICINKYKNTKK